MDGAACTSAWRHGAREDIEVVILYHVVRGRYMYVRSRDAPSALSTSPDYLAIALLLSPPQQSLSGTRTSQHLV